MKIERYPILSNAIALALLTTAGCIVVYRKLPRKVRRIIEKYSLVTDLVCLITVYYILGGTLTALVAGALVGLFVSVLLHVANHEEDFLVLYDLRDFLKSKFVEAKTMFETYSATYRQKKEEVPA